MNVDTKIASKALALRMKTVIPNIINCDQTAYVKNRFIGESIRLINDLLYHTEQENLDGILFAADMEKAFDSSEHNFIYANLEKNWLWGRFHTVDTNLVMQRKRIFDRIFQFKSRHKTGRSFICIFVHSLLRGFVSQNKE